MGQRWLATLERLGDDWESATRLTLWIDDQGDLMRLSKGEGNYDDAIDGAIFQGNPEQKRPDIDGRLSSSEVASELGVSVTWRDL